MIPPQAYFVYFWKTIFSLKQLVMKFFTLLEKKALSRTFNGSSA